MLLLESSRAGVTSFPCCPVPAGYVPVFFRSSPRWLLHHLTIAYVAALVVNFPDVKDQNKKIKESGMIDAMANAIIAMLPGAITPHLYWFVALLAVPLLMILGTNAFYYALLPIVIGVDLSIGGHIRYSLRILWPASI